MHTGISLLYSDEASNTHQSKLSCQEYQWNQLLTQNAGADASLFSGWSNVFKPLIAESFEILGWRLINRDGSVVKEYLPPATVAGTHAVGQQSFSATIGLTYSAFATGASGRGHHGTTHVFCGHSDFLIAGIKYRATSAVAVIDAYRTWLIANIPVAVGNDVAANFKPYYTMQYNSYYQRKYGC